MESRIIENEKKTILQTYKRLPVSIDYAKGNYIYDKEGHKYLDFLAGIAVNILGHGHPKIIEAIEHQIKRYMHVSNYFYQDVQVEFAQKIIELSGFDKVFLANSGTEAMEGALKLIRRWGNLNNKHEIIAFTGGFHGRTFGALSLMDKPHYKDAMGPFLENIKVIEYNDPEALAASVNENTAALVLEIIQGEGGIVVADEKWIGKIMELKKIYDFKIVADEIQAGSGRTGKFLSFEHYNIMPNVVTLAKGIGGGLPLGAFLVDKSLSEVFKPGMHGTTFGGNPVACAAGIVVLDELRNGIMENAQIIGNYLEEQLNKIQSEFPSLVLEIRGKGLMRGLLLSFEASELVHDLVKRKVITNSASGYILRLLPPLTIGKEEVDTFINELRYCLANSKY